MKKILLLLFFLFLSSSQAQQSPGMRITYARTSNGKPEEPRNDIVVFSDATQTLITTAKIISKKADYPFEQSYIDRKTGFYIQTAQLSSVKKTMTIDSTSIAKQSFEITGDTKTILGYKCEKAKIIINSNTIELWFTTLANLKAAPTVLGQNLGLVLEVTRNGNYSITAEKIEEIRTIPASVIPSKKTNPVDALTYRDLLWKSRFTTIPVFKNEVINFSDGSKSNDSILRFAKGTIIVRKMKLPIIKKGSNVFVDVKEQSNGDAYDRTGSVFIIPTDNVITFMDGLKNSASALPIYENGNGKQYQGVVRSENYSPLLELMRFFTPFGVKQYNTIKLKNKTWQDSVFYRQDISELLPALSGKEVWIGTGIGNYDKGGHKVSVNLTIHPEEETGRPKNNFVLPLFDTNNVLEMDGQEYATMFNNEKGLEVTFTLKENLKNARLRYITTGHGGWENGDEFVPKKNTILLDGKAVAAFVPWRTDCGSFRSYNPASGNFENGLSSSDYSRSNWCPGTVTNPVYIDLGDLPAGNHTIQVKIPQGANEGTSFSAWNVSGVLLGEAQN